MDDVIGYVFGIGSLVNAADPLLQHAGIGPDDYVYGHLDGYRRAWTAAVDNTLPIYDTRHYVDALTRERLNACMVVLSADVGEGRMNGAALPVTENLLPVFDRREVSYDRVDVTDVFIPQSTTTFDASLPVWTYTATAQIRSIIPHWRARGRLYYPKTYQALVHRAFKLLGADAWNDYCASTDEPDCPTIPMKFHRTHLDLGNDTAPEPSQ